MNGVASISVAEVGNILVSFFVFSPLSPLYVINCRIRFNALWLKNDFVLCWLLSWVCLFLGIFNGVAVTYFLSSLCLFFFYLFIFCLLTSQFQPMLSVLSWTLAKWPAFLVLCFYHLLWWLVSFWCIFRLISGLWCFTVSF